MLNYNMELKLELCMIIHISGKNRDYTYYIRCCCYVEISGMWLYVAFLSFGCYAVYGVESSYIA